MSDNSEENEGAERAAREWVAARLQAGNWYDIAPTEEIPRSIKPDHFIVLQMFQFRFAPEIRKRLSEGRIDHSFVLRMAQFVQRDGAPPEVRLNEEIRGEAAVRLKRAVPKGGNVYVEDLDGVEGFDLNPDEMDARHCTLFSTTNGQWRMFFDFRMWRREVGQLLDISAEFLAVAKVSVENGHNRSSVDALFTACEHVAKAHLILHHHSRLRSSKKHSATHSAINRWSHLGNVEEGFAKLFNRLFDERNPAKYDTDVEVTPPSDEDFALIEAEIQALRESIASRVAQILDS